MHDAQRPFDPILNRRQLLQTGAAAALSLGGLGSFGCSKPETDGPLVVGGLAVTCNLTLPIACVARAAANQSAAGGAPQHAFTYSKYNGWPEIKE